MEERDRVLTISEMSLALKLPKHTLRYWEKEFSDYLVPQRSRGRQRRYKMEDMDLIDRIRRLRDRGMSIQAIKRKITEGNGEMDSHRKKIDFLADKVAAVVKAEVYHFFEGEREKI